jgi:UDP-N-acetylglucosamine acyltransferase
MAIIHPTAIVHEGAKFAISSKVGPFCIVGEGVELGENVELVSHVSIVGRTVVGDGTKIFPFAAIGHDPQDLKYAGESSRITIGKNNKIREHVTIHPGTSGDKMETKIGDNCLFMVAAHVAHDCVVGNNVILANNATLAGHVHVGDFAIVGGLSAVHQFVRIGAHAIIGGMSGIASDIIPYGSASGERAGLVGLNLIGLKRRSFSKEDINNLRKVYNILFLENYDSFDKRIKDVEEEYSQNECVSEVIRFLKENELRSICFPKDL